MAVHFATRADFLGKILYHNFERVERKSYGAKSYIFLSAGYTAIAFIYICIHTDWLHVLLIIAFKLSFFVNSRPFHIDDEGLKIKILEGYKSIPRHNWRIMAQ